LLKALSRWYLQFKMMRKFIVYALIVLTVFVSGCHSLRKKFIRPKKNIKEPPVYIDFKDYPEVIPKEAYIDYYLFVRGWLDELIGAFEKNDSYKRKFRAINEAVNNVEQIIYHFNRQGKDAIYPIYEQLKTIKYEIERQPNMSRISTNTLTRRTEAVKRRFEKEFNYTDAEKWLN
jgi:hypothetical protein